MAARGNVAGEDRKGCRRLVQFRIVRFSPLVDRARSEIECVLDEGLHETDERTLFKQKCDSIFDLVVDYASRGRSGLHGV